MRLGSRNRALVVLAVFALIWFWGLGHRPLFNTDEGRYAEISREMLVSGNWVTPRLNGLRYFEKPPLQYWGEALGYKIFGVHDWVARLYSALASFLTVLLVGWSASRLYQPSTGWLAGALLAGSFYFGFLGHFNTLDAGLTFSMTLTLFGFLLAIRAPPGSRNELLWMLAAYAGAALAVLSKGLVGVLLPGAVLVLYLLIRRDWGLMRRLRLFPGLMLFFALVLPWFVAVSIQNRDFLWQFFMVQQFLRFLTPVSHRSGPAWYFIPLLLIAIMPWWGAAVQGLWGPLRKQFDPQARRGFDADLVLWLWVVFIFAFFSVSHSKLPSYILPIMPALAVLLASELEVGSHTFWSVPMLSLLVGLILVLAGILSPRWFIGKPAAAYIPGLLPWLYAAGGVLIIIALVAWALRQRRFSALFLVAGSWVIATRLILLGGAALGPLYSTRALVAEVASYNRPGVAVYSIGGYQQTLPFYLRRNMILVSYQGELQFGIDHARYSLQKRYIPTLREFSIRWRLRHRALGFAPRTVLSKLDALGVRYRIVGENPRWVALVPVGMKP